MAKTTNEKGAGRKALPEAKVRTSTHLRKSLMRNLKYIVFNDEITLTDLMDAALVEYIRQWEKKNGPIPQK